MGRLSFARDERDLPSSGDSLSLIQRGREEFARRLPSRDHDPADIPDHHSQADTVRALTAQLGRQLQAAVDGLDDTRIVTRYDALATTRVIESAIEIYMRGVRRTLTHEEARNV
jgi:hypothetical protein